MPLYRFESNSPLDEIHIVKNSMGALRAYLHAREGTSPTQLAAIQQGLIAHGHKGTPYTENGQFYLEVRGLKSEDELLNQMKSGGFTQGTPSISAIPEDTISREEKFHNRTLKLSGLFYYMGDAGYLYYGIKDYMREKTRANAMNIGAGVAYAMGSTALAIFGNRDQSQNQIQDAGKKIEGFLTQQNVGVPEDSSLHQATQRDHNSPIKSAYHFLTRYPSELMSVMYIGVGLLLGTAAYKNAIKPQQADETLKQFKARKLEKWLDVGLGSMTASSSLAGIIISEKKPIPGQEKRGGLAGAWDWVQEKPLRLTGYGLMVSTMCHAVSTVIAYREAHSKDKMMILGRAVFVITNIAAEIMLLLSSKGHGQGVKADASVETTILATTAELVAKQDPSLQEALISSISDYMCKNHIVNRHADAIAVALREQVDAMAKNPWVDQVTSSPTPPTLHVETSAPATPSTQVHSIVPDAQLQKRLAQQAVTAQNDHTSPNTHNPDAQLQKKLAQQAASQASWQEQVISKPETEGSLALA